MTQPRKIATTDCPYTADFQGFLVWHERRELCGFRDRRELRMKLSFSENDKKRGAARSSLEEHTESESESLNQNLSIYYII
jgi:hypothetical protein